MPKNPQSILSADDLRWFGRWLSEKQIAEGLSSLKDPSRNLAFDTLEVARSRVEQGHPPYGKLWEEPSAEENQKAIAALKARTARYNL
jgi:hypothetical protein